MGRMIWQEINGLEKCVCLKKPFIYSKLFFSYYNGMIQEMDDHKKIRLEKFCCLDASSVKTPDK
jgi:hypothetical protein